MTGEAFARTFGFTQDLLVADPEKIHDILAEPLFVLDLDANGFSDIEKLPNRVKAHGMPVPVADFTVRRHGVRFAIEIKTIRTESWIEEGKLLGDATKPRPTRRCPGSGACYCSRAPREPHRGWRARSNR